MKNSIEGFSQAYAMTLKKEVEQNGKLVTRKVDCTDLVILRWLVDFYPKMRTMDVDGERYVMLTFGKLQKDLPLLDISKRALSERLQKLVDFKILKYKFIKDGGTFSLFAFGENYINLVRSTDDGVCVQPTTGYAIDQQRGMHSTDDGVCVQPTTGYAIDQQRGMHSTDDGVRAQPTTKDNSIINNSIINKEEKEEKEKTINDIIAEQKEELQEPLQEYVKMRKAIKKPITTHGLELALKRLNELTDDTDKAVKIINQSIMNSWQGLFELKSENKTNATAFKSRNYSKEELDSNIDNIDDIDF